MRDYLALVPLDVEALELPTLVNLDSAVASSSPNKVPSDNLLKGKFVKETYAILRECLNRLFSA